MFSIFPRFRSEKSQGRCPQCPLDSENIEGDGWQHQTDCFDCCLPSIPNPRERSWQEDLLRTLFWRGEDGIAATHFHPRTSLQRHGHHQWPWRNVPEESLDTPPGWEWRRQRTIWEKENREEGTSWTYFLRGKKALQYGGYTIRRRYIGWRTRVTSQSVGVAPSESAIKNPYLNNTVWINIFFKISLQILQMKHWSPSSQDSNGPGSQRPPAKSPNGSIGNLSHIFPAPTKLKFPLGHQTGRMWPNGRLWACLQRSRTRVKNPWPNLCRTRCYLWPVTMLAGTNRTWRPTKLRRCRFLNSWVGLQPWL